jgi:hypothetical protein
LTGAAAGALVGGLAAQHAQKDRKDESVVMTLLGAAVGGLAINAAVDKYEEKKQGEERVLHRVGRSGSGSGKSRRSRRHRDSFRGYRSNDERGSRFDDGISRTGSLKVHRRRYKDSKGYGSDGYD